MTTQINETFSTDLGEMLVDIANSGYAIDSGYLVRNDRSAANRTSAAIVYADCSADLTLETQFILPNKSSGTAVLKLIYRYASSASYRHILCTFNGSSITASHRDYASSTDYLTTVFDLSLAASPGDTIKLRMVLRGNDLFDNSLINITQNTEDNNYQWVPITSVINGNKISETHCGISFDSVDTYIANGAPDSGTSSYKIDYIKADDVMIYNNSFREFRYMFPIKFSKFGGTGTTSIANNISASGGPVFAGTGGDNATNTLSFVGGVSASGTTTDNIINNISTSGGPAVSGIGVDNIINNISTSGGPRFGGIGVDNVNYTITTSGGITINGVIANNVVSVYSSTGNILLGGENSDSFTLTYVGGAAFGGGSTLQMEYNNTTSGDVILSGSTADHVEYSNGGTSIGGGGTVQMEYTISKQNDLINNTFYIGGYLKDIVPVRVGGYSVLSGESNYISIGGLIIGGKKFPGNYQLRRKIIIPANTFTLPTTFYLGVRFISSGSCLVYNSSESLIKHELRSYCIDGGLTHIFYNADVIDPTIDNFWYLYY